MWRQGWFIGRKDMQYMLRERASIAWMFIMPIVFFYFIGTVTSNYASSGGSQDRLAVWTDGDAGFLGARLRQHLQERQYQITTPTTEAEWSAAARRLRVPAGFTDSVLAARPVTLRFSRKDSGLGSDYDRIRVGRAVYTLLADVIVCNETGMPPTCEARTRLSPQTPGFQSEIQAETDAHPFIVCGERVIRIGHGRWRNEF